MKTLSRFLVFSIVLTAFLSCHSDKSMPTQPSVTTRTPMPMMTSTPMPMMTQTPKPMMTQTPMPMMTPTPAAAHMVNVGQGGNRFFDVQSGTTTTTIHVGDTVTWTWVAGPHSTTSGMCCTTDGMWDSGVKSSGTFSHTFSSAGTFPYFCMVHLSAMTGQVMVQP